jgi:NAD(P)-dependent dehydrogenase (short-subunit alcohol dehydrogenase family)
VVLACRDQGRGAAARDALNQQRRNETLTHSTDRGRALLRLLDLGDLGSVASFATGLQQWLDGGGMRLRLLVCNAGLNSASASAAAEAQLTADGVDLLYQVNYLSHFYLTCLLLPVLHRAALASARPSRVLNITSVMHRHADPGAFTPAGVSAVRKSTPQLCGKYNHRSSSHIQGAGARFEFRMWAYTVSRSLRSLRLPSAWNAALAMPQCSCTVSTPAVSDRTYIETGLHLHGPCFVVYSSHLPMPPSRLPRRASTRHMARRPHSTYNAIVVVSSTGAHWVRFMLVRCCRVSPAW